METCELVVTALKEQGRQQDQDLPVSTSCKQTSLLPACCDLQSLERRYIKGSGLIKSDGQKKRTNSQSAALHLFKWSSHISAYLYCRIKSRRVKATERLCFIRRNQQNAKARNQTGREVPANPPILIGRIHRLLFVHSHS